jgi:hypothetical protein
LNSRLAALEAQPKARPDGSAQPKTETDTLTKFLTDPDGFFSERDKGLSQIISQAVKEAAVEQRKLDQARSDRSEAIKILDSLDGLDIEENDGEVYQLLEEELGMDDGYVEFLFKTQPSKTASLVRKLWEKKHSLALSDKDRAAKSAAKPVSVGGGQTHSKVTLADINARAKGAKSSEDLEKLWAEAERLS